MCSFQRIRLLLLAIPVIIGLLLILTWYHRHSSRVVPDGAVVVLSSAAVATTSTTMCTTPCIIGDESMIMQPKEYGTSSVPIQANLRWHCDSAMANRICNYNRHYAEYFGYWERDSTFLPENNNNNNNNNGVPNTAIVDPSSSSSSVTTANTTITFYDSNTGLPLFTIPGTLKLRTIEDFLQESHLHGWPSFRTDEVHWEHVRVLPDGETVSINGTHLGHNLPDPQGDRFCINLLCIAGNPV